MNEKIAQQEPLRVALYIRVSTDDQVEKYGPELQKEALLSLIKSKGKLSNGKDMFVLAGDKHIYLDEGISGTIPATARPAFARLKEDILLADEDNKPFDLVAVYKIDRFARRLKVLLEIIDFFEDNEIKFISANESIDTSTPFGKAILGIIGVIAELEIETIKQRTHDGREQAIKRGVVMGTFSAYGYVKNEEKKLKVFEEEAKTVRMIFDMFINEKQSAYQISKQLTALSILAPEASAVEHKKKQGKIKKKTSLFFWREDAIRKILRDELYIGKYYYNKGARGKYFPKEQWKLSEHRPPSIIDKFTFEKAQNLIESSKHERKHTRSNHTYLLSGLLSCDSCFNEGNDKSGRARWIGERKEIKKGTGKYTYFYKCGHKNLSKYEKICTTLPLPANEIENYMIEFCKKLIRNPIAAYNHQVKLNSSKIALTQLKKKEEALQGLINDQPIRREQILEQHKLSLISTTRMQKQIKEVVKVKESLQNKLNEIQRQISQSVLSMNYKETLKLFSGKYKKNINTIFKNRKETYDLIHQLIEEIVVYSRPIKKSDIVAGKRKKDQQIPFRLHIKLKLPQDILHDLTNRFGVEMSHLWARRDSNPHENEFTEF